MFRTQPAAIGIFVLAICTAGGTTTIAAQPADRAEEAAEITVYRRIRNLTIKDEGRGTTKTIDLQIEGSAGLKVAFLARGSGGVNAVPLNMADKVAGDNTTSKSYRLIDEKWRPVLYCVDRFRYNGGAPDGTIRKNTLFTNLLFHGNQTSGKGVLEVREMMIYRGEDRTPPAAPDALKATVRDDGVHLTWQPAKDNAGVALYAISRTGDDGRFNKVGQSCRPEYVDEPPARGGWRYRVLAVDYEDNVGQWSETLTIDVPRGWEQAKPSVLESDRVAYGQNIRAIHEAGKGKVTKGRVLCFGDSLTGATLYRVYTESALGRYAVEAIGRAGWRTDGCRGVIDEDLKKLNPEFCLVLLGTNNGKAERELPKAMEDLVAMAQSCRNNGTVPIIGTIPPRGFNDPASAPEARYNQLLIDTCRRNGIPIAYIFEAFQAAPDGRKLLAGDGVHLIDGGWATVAPAWRDAMEQVNFVLLDRP